MKVLNQISILALATWMAVPASISHAKSKRDGSIQLASAQMSFGNYNTSSLNSARSSNAQLNQSARVSLSGTTQVKYYNSGPFKGGKAIIQYAKDRSKTTIQIFNKNGRLIKTMTIKSKRPAAPVMDSPATSMNVTEAASAPKAAAANTSLLSSMTKEEVAADPGLSAIAQREKENRQEAREEQKLRDQLNPLLQIDAAKGGSQINDPEKGVRPVFKMDESRGPRYGNFREFEKRVVTKRNPKTTVEGYNYYVDEIDRKEGRRVISYYKFEDRKPQLIAVEKFNNVSFFSNYEVKDNGEGKLTTY